MLGSHIIPLMFVCGSPSHASSFFVPSTSDLGASSTSGNVLQCQGHYHWRQNSWSKSTYFGHLRHNVILSRGVNCAGTSQMDESPITHSARKAPLWATGQGVALSPCWLWVQSPMLAELFLVSINFLCVS